MLLEHTTEERVRREVAAERLRELADEIARQNEVTFLRGEQRFTVAVPQDVVFTLEIEVGGDGNEIEVELKW